MGELTIYMTWREPLAAGVGLLGILMIFVASRWLPGDGVKRMVVTAVAVVVGVAISLGMWTLITSPINPF